MSSKFSKVKKSLSGVMVVPAEKVWIVNSSGKYQLNPELDVIGKIDMEMPSMVLKANKPQHKTDFIEDISELPQRTKKELVSHFYDDDGTRNKRTKAYLIRTDKDSKGKKSVKAKNRPRT